MAGYQIVQFGSVDLPLYNSQQALDVATAASALVATVGGTFDVRGARRGVQGRQVIEISGVYYGQPVFLVDGAGNYLVDQAGNYLVVGSGPNLLRAQIDQLRAMVGMQAPLWRLVMDTGARQWRTARLLSLAHPATVQDRMVLAHVTVRFEAAAAAWRAQTASSVAAAVAVGNPAVLNGINSGNIAIGDATLTIAAGGSITSVAVTGAGISLAWTGSLANGQSLVVDCGALTVRKAGADAYAGFSLAGGHTADGWLPLAVGNNNWLTVTANGPGTVTLGYSNQFL